MKNSRFSSTVIRVFTWLLLIVATSSLVLYNLFCSPMHFKTKDPIILVISKSSSAKSFVAELKARELIKYDKVFLVYIRFLGDSKKLKAGVYAIEFNESAKHLLKRIVSGDVLIKNFQIIEGTKQAQISANLKKAPYLDYDPTDWKHVFTDEDLLNSFCASTSLGQDKQNLSEKCVNTLKDRSNLAYLEGLFLADTYQYNSGTKAKILLLRAYTNLKSYLTNAWIHRDLSLPYKNPYELLVAASILEKESAYADERRLISGVIVNRLENNMPLQMDPTVIYGLGDDYTGTLTHKDLDILSKYNTYRYRGLPPTPITMVGRISIDAAAHPLATKYFYFVAKGDGTHIFSETYSEQKQAIKKHLGNLNEH